MSTPDWLLARPIAHRGLHARARGVIENTASAARAAIARGFAIECDVQVSADGEAMVFHDFTLDRLTTACGRMDAWRAEALLQVALTESSDRIMPLGGFLDVIGGQTPLVCEIKSRFDGDMRLARRVAEIAAVRPGPLALKSFDPDVIAFLRQKTPSLGIPLGVVAMAAFHDAAAEIDMAGQRSLAAFLHWERTRPDFLSYCVDDLPHAVPYLLRTALGVPVMTWTVSDATQAEAARRWADQMIFEGDAILPAALRLG